MDGESNPEQDLAALNELLVNCPDFERIERLLGGFNLFQVLRFEHGEIRHSNVLAWLMDPLGSHGLGDLFLRKWLMRVVYEADSSDAMVSAVDIDGLELSSVEVRREWRNIDVLVIVRSPVTGKEWVFCIENKILSRQHSNQLVRYREIVEREFPQAEKRLFLFLTIRPELPEDSLYLSASYAQVHQTLRECLEARRHAIGEEPRVLIENYARLLQEQFMEDSEIARTARRIYQQHRRALDIIFEHRPDNLGSASERLRAMLEDRAEALGIQLACCTKYFIRFIPREWDQPGNSHGSAWPGSDRTMVFELNLAGKRPYLVSLAGKAPDAWIDPLWQRAGSAPFRLPRKRVSRPRHWCSLYYAEGVPVGDLDPDTIADPNELADRLFKWIEKSLKEPAAREFVAAIAAELPKLDAICRANSSQ